MADDFDPEIQADLDLRAASMRDRKRSKRAPVWAPPKIVDTWPCRACKKATPVVEDAMDRYVAFNAELARRGEHRLDHTAILFCDSCRAEYMRTAATRRRAQVDRLAPVIQQLKKSKSPEQEYAAIKQLETWKHPDVQGLIAAIRARLDTKGRKPASGDV